MEAELLLAYHALNALSQGKTLSPHEIEIALAGVNSALGHVRSMRRAWESMGRELRAPVITLRMEAIPDKRLDVAI